MSNIDDQDDWSNDSASLFREARRAHDPTRAETARLAAVLERIQAQKATVSLASKRAADVVAPAVSRQVLRQVASVSLGAVCIAAASYAFIHFNRQPAEPARIQKPAPAAIVSAPPPSALQPTAAPRSEAGASALPAGARDSRSQRRRAHATTEKQRTSRIEPAVASGAASSAPADLATTQNSTAAHDRPTPRSTGKAAAQSRDAKPFESEPQQTETAVADKPATPPPAAPTELALMKRMQGALREADYSRALTLCAEHARRWPHGVFELEREGVRAIAACGENTDDAVQRAKRFLAAHPQAPVALRVSAACAAQLAKR